MMATPAPLRAIVAAALLALTVGAAAETRLPAWRQLDFEQVAFWVTAQSQIRLEANDVTDSTPVWTLQAESSVANSAEQVSASFDPIGGQLQQRSRLSRGKEQRFKLWRYLADGIVRERRQPDTASPSDPASWPITSRRELAPPAPAICESMTDPYILLLLAGRSLDPASPQREYCVNTDLNFYRVSITPAGLETVEVDYARDGEAVRSSVEARVVQIRATPLGTPEDKPDFSLLGLEGDIDILFAADSELPVQLRGRAPRIGATTIDLRAVSLRAELP
jgi:hypothetical protein